ncbi:MAG: peptidase domain-containing ABC transporter [Chitinophagaceae bacterium]|nr:peptidase domain-containing ABC transporter [Chitinophagaceae bacterium]
MNKNIKFIKQSSLSDCGPTCLAMITKFYGSDIPLNNIRTASKLGMEGVSLLGLATASEQLDLKTLSVEIPFEKLIKEAPLPCIIHWNQNHFVVVTPNSTIKKVEVADPAHGIIKYTREEFCNHWLQTTDDVPGIALLLEPTPEFYQRKSEKVPGVSWGFLLRYVKQYKRYFFQLVIGLLIASALQLVFPFLTQSIVDVGINTRNLQYIYIILFAQLFLFTGRIVTEFIRSHLLLHIGTRINISILSDFWIKLMQLPLSYFDTKKTGDTLQRIEDNNRIQQFLTTGSLSVLFSLINLLVFSIVLLLYNLPVFFVFLTGSLLYFLWIRLFLQYRRKLDVERFGLAGKENTATMQLVQGMQEIRLNNCEKPKRWEWERLQAALFRISFKGLQISQYQQAGAFFINEGKNIIITFFVAKAVIDGQLTLGAMLAIQYIIGQLSSPVEQLIGFMQQAQDAKLSLERLNEIHALNNEETPEQNLQHQLPVHKSIQLNNLSFTYTGAGNEPVLRDINLYIPEKKVTAIVGMSGSGKTTLIKLLLKFYEEYLGDIEVGGTNIKYISHSFWRSNCSSVMQDGFIFNDTIANNIALDGLQINRQQLVHACKVANILTFIESLPLGFNTKIGMEGTGISQGQRQRILIARAVYKNPQYIFFDEATNALDANNEIVILKNLNSFFKNKTVVVIAHRLSTVKNADKIVVLHNGKIVEEGTHTELTLQKGYYFELVKNQLELGN